MAETIIHNGDHAEFEREWAGRDPRERPDWPLPSFDAADWAEAFCKRFSVTMGGKQVIEPEGLMIGWFANALMRGFDEHARRAAPAASRPAVSPEAIEAAAAAYYDGMTGPAEERWPHHEGWAGKSETFKSKVRAHMARALEAAALAQGEAARG